MNNQSEFIVYSISDQYGNIDHDLNMTINRFQKDGWHVIQYVKDFGLNKDALMMVKYDSSNKGCQCK